MTPLDKARILITEECQRGCSYCCNRYGFMDDTYIISDVDDLQGRSFREIMVTGGEPLLHPDLFDILYRLRRDHALAKIYLYTAYTLPSWGHRFPVDIKGLMNLIDGLQYTIHADANELYIYTFEELQEELAEYINKSFRLYIHEDNELYVKIIPNIWNRLEVKGWMAEEVCPSPAELGEEVYIVRE